VKWTLAALCVLVVLPPYVCSQTPDAAIQREMSKIDALCADPDLKLAVVAAMADSVQVHRNHLLLLHKDTGQSFATIFVSELRAHGIGDEGILRSLSALLREVKSQLARYNVVTPGATAPRPVLSVRSSIDYNSSGTLYSLVPEFGVDSSHAAVVVGIPYYRTFGASVSSGGLGDVYVAGFLRGRTAGLDFGSALTIGAPTGDRNKGFGSGKVTVDATGTMARRLEFARPWVSAGFANSVFNNAGYQRPYITDGNAIHVSGGVDFTLPRKLAVGIGGFGLEPIGNQVVYSETVQAGSPGSSGTQQPGQQNGGGMMPGGNMGPGMGNGGGTTMPPATSMPFYDRTQQSVVSASDLRDYGASAWLSVPLHAGLSLSSVVSRSVPFHLTTIRVSIGVDLARLLFPGKHF
jgi:hypothetical protein